MNAEQFAQVWLYRLCGIKQNVGKRLASLIRGEFSASFNPLDLREEANNVFCIIDTGNAGWLDPEEIREFCADCRPEIHDELSSALDADIASLET